MKAKIGKWIGTVLLLIAIILLAYLLFFRVFVLRNVKVTGGSAVDSAEILRAAKLDMGASVFRIDEAQVRANINALGEVCAEEINVHLPDTLEIKVRDRVELAMLSWKDAILTLDEDLHVVRQLPHAPDADMLYITGLEVDGFILGDEIAAPQRQIATCGTAIRGLQASAANMYVSEIDVGDLQNVLLITRSGIRVQLGSGEEMTQKLSFIKAAVADLEHRGESGGELVLSGSSKADYQPDQNHLEV